MQENLLALIARLEGGLQALEREVARLREENAQLSHDKESPEKEPA